MTVEKSPRPIRARQTRTSLKRRCWAGFVGVESGLAPPIYGGIESIVLSEVVTRPICVILNELKLLVGSALAVANEATWATENDLRA